MTVKKGIMKWQRDPLLASTGLADALVEWADCERSLVAYQDPDNEKVPDWPRCRRAHRRLIKLAEQFRTARKKKAKR